MEINIPVLCEELAHSSERNFNVPGMRLNKFKQAFA